MKNIINFLRKKRIENLTNKLIKELQIKGLKIDPEGDEINIWVYMPSAGKEITITHTGNNEVMQNYGKFPLYKGVSPNE